MAGTIYSGTYPNGIILSDPGTQETVTVTGTVTNTNTDAIFGTTAFPWTVDNKATIANSGTAGSGIQLVQGGTVNNQVAAALIAGYDQGVLIKGAPGLATNFGTIESTCTASNGINFTEGGRVVNGSTSATGALIEGGSHGILIKDATGTVANFGTITNSNTHADIVLFAGGSVTNGASASTAAIIAANGGGTGVYINNGTGTVTNFGRIIGATGINLRTGGTVINGLPGSTAATITGTSHNGVLITGAAGTVSNFGTINTTGTNSGVSLIQGGGVTNGSSAVISALITSTGSGVYIANAPGTVTNFGTIAATSTLAGTGVSLEAGGTVVNSGTISNIAPGSATVYMRGGGTVTNTKNGTHIGLISGVSAAIVFRGGAGTVTNSGSIQSSTSSGIYINGGGTITNQVGGMISGQAAGVYSRGVAITLTNSGTIRNPGFGNAMYLRGGGGVVNNLGGTIAGGSGGDGVRFGAQGGVVANAGVITGFVGVYNNRSGSLTLTNSGTISSGSGAVGTAVQLGNSVGKDLLVVEAGSTFIGAVNGGGRAEIEFVPGGAANMTNVFGFATVGLGNGTSHTLILTDANFSNVSPGRITVFGGDSGNSVNASTVTAGSVVFVGGAGADHFTGGGDSDTFNFSATTLTGADTVAGNGGFDNTLRMTSAGTVIATWVSGVEIYQLANGGANSLSLANANFTGVNGGFIRVYGGNAGNTVNGSGVTTAADQLVIYGGSGLDHLTGGAGNDVFVFTPTTLNATDTVIGGGGTDELLMTAHGTINAGGVSGIENFVLASGGTNTLALTNANFTSVSGATIHVLGGAASNRVDDSAVTGTNKLVFTGGAGNDIIVAGSRTTITGGAGTNQFTFDHIGTNSITDFATSATNELVFSNSGFGLGLGGATSTPQALSASLIGSLTSGTFSNTTQRFAYNQSTGQLLFGADGNGGASNVVATLTGDPGLTAARLFFVS